MIQITDSLYTRSGLRKEKTRQRVSEAINAISGHYARPVVMTYKEFSPENPEAVTPLKITHPKVVNGYFGRHDRALNVPEMMEADAMIIAGTPYDNISATRRTIHALLFDAAPRPAPAPLYRKTYLRKDAQGYGRARKLKVDPDPHVQAAIDHQVGSRIWQSLGRLRAIRREGEPIDVWLVTAYPVTCLPVTELKKMYHVLQENHPLAAVNQQRADTYRERAAAALAQMEEEGESISRRALRDRIGGSDRDATRAVNAYREKRKVIGGYGTHRWFTTLFVIKETVGTIPPNRPENAPSPAISTDWKKPAFSFWLGLIRGTHAAQELDKLRERVDRIAAREDLPPAWTEEITKAIVHQARTLVEPECIKAANLPRNSPDPERSRQQELVAILLADCREEYEERAAILEFDAGFERREAEIRALSDLAADSTGSE